MYAGTFLGRQKFDEYYEFDKKEKHTYYKLKDKKLNIYPKLKVKQEIKDLDKNKKTDVANRAHMMFKVKVNEPLKVNDMLVKANNTININNN